MNPWGSIISATAAEFQGLLDGLQHCSIAQTRRLNAILSANADSTFGRRYRFAGLDGVDAFRRAVPLCSYEDLAAQMWAGSAHGLVGEQVLLYEETSGSSGGAKLIPYTQQSLRGFSCAVRPWLHDLASWLPGLGRGYFSISPATRKRKKVFGGVPVGSNSDAIYFGREIGKALDTISLVPPQVSDVSEMEQWQHLTLLYLLSTEDLTFLSFWSPTFLTALLAELPGHAEVLLRDLHDGLRPALSGARPVERDPARAATVARALTGARPDTSLLWPHLQLLSAWTHASAARFVDELAELFPKAKIQGKGLLATEGVVSVPLHQYQYPVLAVHSGFYEFLDEAGRSLLAHEVVPGQAYEVVMTVPGLYRYRNGDRVRIRGRAGSAPQLEFVGRVGLISDLVGEKLNESFVCDCLCGIRGFAMLAPKLEPKPHYQLFLEEAAAVDPETTEAALRTNPQYAYARALGQLDPLELIEVRDPLRRYKDWALESGQRLGDIKPPSLRPENDWEARLCS